MPYKDPEKQKAAKREWARRHASEKKRQRDIKRGYYINEEKYFYHKMECEN